MHFSYEQAFSRNIGWVTAEEQQLLREKRVAIAGLGGVGGIHLLTLTRLGIGKFHLADLDTFDIANFNRQAGASVSTLGRPKAEVMAEQALDINPELEITMFGSGVSRQNLDDFLSGVDLYLDGLDFFAFDARQDTFAACARKRIPAVTAAPLGMGTAVLNFLPGGMTFDEYFQFGDLPENEKALRFLIGLSPAMLQRRYLADPSAVDLAARKGPSTVMACQLCAGAAATEVLKILLGRGPLLAAPRGYHFDAYRNKFVRTWRPGGNANPLQKLVLALAKRQLQQAVSDPPGEEARSDRPAEKILDLARWAPSGDNTQPWRFEVVADDYVIVHGFDTRDHCVYDLDGRPSQIAIGALLENVRLAASEFGVRAEISRRSNEPENRPIFDVRLHTDPTVSPDPLANFIRARSVQRRSMSTRRLSTSEKLELEAAVGEGYRVVWLEDLPTRVRTARLMWSNAHLRLTMPEAYEVHRDVIEWKARFSASKVPDAAIGLDPLATSLMRYVMKSWERVRFFNTYLAGTLLPRLELDFLPAVACGAHFLIVAERPPATIDDYVSGGGAMQRFWLTATRLGLQVQPEMTPLIFSRYVREGRSFSAHSQFQAEAERLAGELEALVGKAASAALFMGRIGGGRAASARSLRLALGALLKRTNP